MAFPTLAISPLTAPPTVTVNVPGSKSHTNRALICAALASGRSRLTGVLFAQDTLAMLESLQVLGLEMLIGEHACTVDVVGLGGIIPSGSHELNVRQSGTTGRFLLPMLTLGSGRYVLDGAEQLRARPFDELVQGLRDLGGRIEGESLPLVIEGSTLRGGVVEVSGTVSSQYLSGLLLSAPCAESETVIEITSDLVSKPYIDLTLATMASFGAVVDNDNYRRFVVANTGYKSADLAIEPDASAASYFFAAAAVTGGSVTVEGLGAGTIQGDLDFVDALEGMGAVVSRDSTSTTVTGPSQLRGIHIDMANISDTAQSLAVVAPFASEPTTVTGIGFIRKKETDRVAAVVQELSRLGIRATEDDDGFTIYPGQPQPGIVDTYDDHRMAMSFAVLGLVAPGVIIENPGCVSKTFPSFFSVLDQLRGDDNSERSGEVSASSNDSQNSGAGQSGVGQ